MSFPQLAGWSAEVWKASSSLASWCSARRRCDDRVRCCQSRGRCCEDKGRGCEVRIPCCESRVYVRCDCFWERWGSIFASRGITCSALTQTHLLPPFILFPFSISYSVHNVPLSVVSFFVSTSQRPTADAAALIQYIARSQINIHVCRAAAIRRPLRGEHRFVT